MTPKKIILMQAAVVMMTLHFSCNSGSKLFEENPPFQLKEVSFQNRFAGAQEFGKETEIFIHLQSIADGVDMDSIYFRGKAEALKKDSTNPLKYTTLFRSKTKKSGIMDKNAVKEMNNPVPDIFPDFPFELQDNEAVVSYRKNKKTYYYKASELKEIQAVSYPSSNPSQGD